MQIMVVLRIFVADSFMLDVADTFGINKPTVCWVVHWVANVLPARKNEFVKSEWQGNNSK